MQRSNSIDFFRLCPLIALLVALMAFGTPSTAELSGSLRKEPFLGDWIHFNALFDCEDDIEAREASIAGALDDCKRSALKTVIPFALTSSGTLAERQQLIRQFDEEGIMATPRNSSYNELVIEAGRKSILSGGREVCIDYQSKEPRVHFRKYD